MVDKTSGPDGYFELPAVEAMALFVALGRTSQELSKSVVHIAKQMDEVEPELLAVLNKLIVALDQQQAAMEALHKAVLKE